MFYIKLTEDKELQVTEREHIYRGENLNGRLIFLIGKAVDELTVEESAVYLSYIRADGMADIVALDKLADRYNESYLQYTLPITCRFTRFPGQICMFLQIYSGDPSNPKIVKTGECRMTVEESRDMDQYFQADRFISALYQHDKRVRDEIERIDADILRGDAELRELIAEKADNIYYDNTDSTIQLTSGGEPIGRKIRVSTTDGKLIDTVSLTADGELVIFFSDGTFTNLGVVVASDGKVYMPHIDEYKILRWTIEDAASEIPAPIDLNPDDEWGNVEDSDYAWESIG